MVAAATRPGSRLTLRQVGLNETRCAVISALRRMGAHMDIVKTSPEDAGEPYGDITIYGAGLPPRYRTSAGGNPQPD